MAAGAVGTLPMSASVQSREVLPHREDFGAPRPLHTTLVALTSTFVPALVWAVGAASARVATVSGGALLGLPAIRAGYAWFDTWRCRALADRLLRVGPAANASLPLADRRAAQLTSERSRRRLVRRVERLARETEHRLRRDPSPLDRAAAARSLLVLRRLESRLGDCSRPISPYGVLVVGELRAASPDALTNALAALDDPR